MGENKDKVVISLGGSLVYPQGGVDTDFLKRFNKFIREELAANPKRQFFIIVGGGTIARHYRDAGREVVGHELSPDDLDWLGIHATKMNAHLIRTIFRDIAHQFVLKHYEIIRKVTEPVVIGSGWKPGWSTDFCSTLMAEDYRVNEIINMSNIEMVYDKDPKKHKDAKPIAKTTWSEFRKIVGDDWIPGLNVPFDPIASKRAQELGLKVVILDGKNLTNLKHYMHGEKFVGTEVNPD